MESTESKALHSIQTVVVLEPDKSTHCPTKMNLLYCISLKLQEGYILAFIDLQKDTYSVQCERNVGKLLVDFNVLFIRCNAVSVFHFDAYSCKSLQDPNTNIQLNFLIKI